MKKFLIACAAVVALTAPSFADQSEEGMNLREMRRAEYLMMKQMIEASMGHMKSQEEMMKHFSEMLQKLIEDCGNNSSTKDGATRC